MHKVCLRNGGVYLFIHTTFIKRSIHKQTCLYIIDGDVNTASWHHLINVYMCHTIGPR